MGLDETWLVSVTESTEGDAWLTTIGWLVGVEFGVSGVEDGAGVDEVEVVEEDEVELVELVELVLDVDKLEVVCGEWSTSQKTINS